MALEVTWDSKTCIHSGNCVKTLPQVFKVEAGKFVIDPAAADDSRRLPFTRTQDQRVGSLTCLVRRVAGC